MIKIKIDQKNLPAWGVHLLTATAGVLGLFTLSAIAQENYLTAFALMSLAVLIDAVDGTLARQFKVSEIVPKVDGTLLDNMMDFINYAITPCFLALWYKPLLPTGIREIVVILILLASAYQFTQTDAKTDDHFFKGFPCYWNIVIFYMFIYDVSPWLNALILLFLVGLVFMPFKYLYLSRMEYAIPNQLIRHIILVLSAIWGVCILGMLMTYPTPWPIFFYYSLLYTIGYYGLSFYLTYNKFPTSLSENANQ